MIWTTQYLEDLAVEAETQIAEECKCILDRISLEILRGKAEYQLPSYVTDIIKITWKGVRLDPIPQIEYDNWIYTEDSILEGAFTADAFTDAYYIDSISVSGTPQGRPERYFYNSFGENVIRFHPAPNEALPILSGDIWNVGIGDGVIIEFYRTPLSPDFQLPEYFRRRTIKAYVLMKAFAREGDGQNLKAAKYFAARYVQLLARAKKIIGHVNQASLNTRSDATNQRHVVARPKLPWNWQTITVDDYDI